MQCQQCKHEWPDDFEFCPRCGITIVADRGSAAAGGRGIATVGNANLSVSGDVTAEQGATVVFAEQGATIVIGEAPVPMTAVDRQSALGRYLHHVISRNRYLQLQGIRSGGRLVHIELDHIYVTLRAIRQRMVETEEEWLAHEVALAPGEARRLDEGATLADERLTIETMTVSVNEALTEYPRLAVLGDPGSGKTTLLRYLALLYARDLAEGSSLVQDKLGLEERGRLPVLLLLRQIGAYLRAHHPTEDGTEGHGLLLDFVLRSLKNERIELPGDFFDEWLVGGRAIILLDGLDEVADPDLRRRVSRLVEAFTRAYPDCRYVVTSRIVGYTGPARLGEEYVTTTIRDFTMADVERFLGNWHRLVAIGQMGPGESAESYAADQTSQLLQAIRSSERIRELSINPLMLTVIAMVHRDRVKLPDRRAELYAEAVDVLLGKWEEAKGIVGAPILGERPFDAGDRRLMLQSVALRMHENEQKEISTEDLNCWLNEMFSQMLGDQRAANRATERFLSVIEGRTGLLVARGEGVYAFSHLTFQEYLAALAVAARDDYVEYTLDCVSDPWWREVILLEAGYLSTQSRERTTHLIQAIADLKKEPEPYHNLVLAAECLHNVGLARVEAGLWDEIQGRIRHDIDQGTLVLMARLSIKVISTPALSQLYALVKPHLSVSFRKRLGQAIRVGGARRDAAARALAQIGGAYWTEPYGEPEWVEVPANGFWMGTQEKEIPEMLARYGGMPDLYEREIPQHRVDLPTYSIARVPVTNAQYRLFVEATNYTSPGYWEEGHPPRGQENHPVINVTWFDTLAYCRWLSQMTGNHITLPSEAEWEKAARGYRDRRVYPWGDDFEANYCNSYELGLGNTTPVGIFPDGASPYGVLGMVGNVWEWTRSLWGNTEKALGFKYPYDSGDGRENLEIEDRVFRVVRGGSFGDSKRGVRCAVRHRDASDHWSRWLGFRVVAIPT